MRVDNSTGKGTSGMDKLSSKVHRVHMELRGKLLSSLRIETQILKRLQSVSVVDGATHTQKDDVESNGGSLGNVAEIFVLACFNSKIESLPPLYFDGVVLLPYTESFKYLGMVCDKQINLNTAADATLCPFTAGTFRVKILIRNLMQHTYTWLFKTHAVPAGMYAGQIWPLLTYSKAKTWTVPYRNGC